MEHKNFLRTLENVKKRFPNSLITEFRGYIIIATDGYDLEAKKNRISTGDNFGFYTIEKAYLLDPIKEKTQFDWMMFFAKIGCGTIIIVLAALIISIFHLIFG